MRFLFLLASMVLASACVPCAGAFPKCESADVAELCRIAQDMRADNPDFGEPTQWTREAETARAQRQLERRRRARAILSETADPTWRDLFNAGYTIAYGDTGEERLLAHAIAIRALSLAPDERDTRFLVAMTLDALAFNYVGMQVYGRQKFYQLNPADQSVEMRCLPRMIDPPLPPSVGAPIDAPPKGFGPCPPGVGDPKP